MDEYAEHKISSEEGKIYDTVFRKVLVEEVKYRAHNKNDQADFVDEILGNWIDGQGMEYIWRYNYYIV